MTRPEVFIIAAITADGFIARGEHELANWTSKADKAFFVQKTKEAGVMIMGRTTFDTIGRPLPDRKMYIYSRSPQSSEFEDIIYTNANPKELINQLGEEGYEQVAITGGASIYTLFLGAGCVDTLYLTIEPQLCGKGLGLLNKPLSPNIDLTLNDCAKLDDDVILLTYRVQG